MGLTASVAVAAALLAWMGGRDWPWLPLVAAAAAVAGWAAGRAGFGGAVLAAGYFVPVLFILVLRRFYDPYLLVWTVALLGVVLSRRPRSSWSVPHDWRAPLSLWALVIALSWPVVALRELDFTPELLFFGRGIANSLVGGLPGEVVTWILSVAVANGVGLLWIDRLFADFHAVDLPRFERSVILPLGISAGLAALVGIYQALFDIGALSGGLWPQLGRAAGSLVDANAFGMLMALWAVGLVALGSRMTRPWAGASAVGALLALGAVWASGSRTALLALVIGLGGIGLGLWRQTAGTRNRSPRVIIGAALLVLGVATAGTWLSLRAGSANPIRRLLETTPGGPGGSVSAASARQVMIDLWERNGYGAAATRIVRDSPFVGCGIGAFHVLSSDYAVLVGFDRIPPDNAQNWYRHQVAELGLVGTLGWLVWAGLLLPAVIRAPRPPSRAFTSTVVQSLVIAVAVVSLLGMPTQNPTVALTFWTLLFWYLRLTDSLPVQRWRSSSRVLALGVWALAIAHLAGTVYLARTEFRVPARALRAGWGYSHGFSPPMLDADGREYRETARRAVDVFPVVNNWLKLTVWADDPNAQADPVEIKIWRGRDLVLRTVARDPTKITRYVQVPPGAHQLMIETWVERTWQPVGGQARGLAVAHWEWIDRPPPEAVAVSIGAS